MAERDIHVDKSSIEIGRARPKGETDGPRKENSIQKPEIHGKVVAKKPSLAKKIVSAFAGEQVDNVGDYILYDVVIPGVKTLMYDVIIGGVGMALFGDSRPRGNARSSSSRITRYGDKSYVSYDRASYRDDRQYSRVNRRAMHEFDDILMESREEAEDVLSYLSDCITEYGQATVYDFKDCVGIDPNYMDRGFGWRALASARIVRDPRNAGYRFDLPPAQPL